MESTTPAADNAEATTPEETKITIYAMPGSQFVAKVLAALGQRKIPHYVVFVPMDIEKRKKFIPSGGTLVPEMTVDGAGADGKPLVVRDSEAILHWVDENCQIPKLFPTDEASELSVRASDKTLAAMVWYYNWVNDDGYRASMQRTIAEMVLPSFFKIFCFRFKLVDMFISSERTKFRAKVKEALTLEDDVVDDEPKMRQMLIEELKYFQSFLKEDGSSQPYLLPGDQPTAADFSVYAQIERLVDGPGESADVKVYASVPHLKEGSAGTAVELKRLWEWHDNMREKCPVQFKGKRPPKN